MYKAIQKKRVESYKDVALSGRQAVFKLGVSKLGIYSQYYRKLIPNLVYSENNCGIHGIGFGFFPSNFKVAVVKNRNLISVN